MADAATPPPRNLPAGAWLLTDMALNVAALCIVKALGLGYPSVQLVFLRAAVGLAVMAPFLARGTNAFRGLEDRGIHVLRVALSAITLTASFYAVARLPLALFTALMFTRPVVTMVMARGLLGERIAPRRWVAAGIALAGVLIAVRPGAAPVHVAGLAAAAVVVLTGTGAVIATRRLRAAPHLVMMTAYTAGITALTAPFALAGWVPVPPAHWPPLLAVGLLAQCAQLCFLRAHGAGEAGFLSVVGYASLIVSAAAGWLAFGEVPGAAFWAGAALIVGAAAWVGARP